MEVVLIPCSGRKRLGGTTQFTDSLLTETLRPSTWERILECRRELARSMRLPPGPDLGLSMQVEAIEFLPAHQRYDGNLYRAARLAGELADSGLITIFVVSAFYGLLNARDLVRHYDLQMAAKSSGAGTIHRYWSRNGLGSVVAESIRFLQPKQVHDMLPVSYRRALAPWPTPDLVGRVKSYGYPGLRMASDSARGRDLAMLMARVGEG